MSDKEDRQLSFIADMRKNAETMIKTVGSVCADQLDFSVESLGVVEELLEEASDFYEDMPAPRKDSLVNMFGCYVMEVARSNFGGTYFWYDALNQPILVTGLPDFEISITACEKVKGRLTKGEEDNIPFYFAGYVERVKTAKKGDKAYIV